MRPGVIELHIEEVVLRGLAGVDGDAVAAALETALAGLLREASSAAWAPVDRASADGGRVEAAGDASALGAGLADAVFAAVTGARTADLGGQS